MVDFARSEQHIAYTAKDVQQWMSEDCMNVFYDQQVIDCITNTEAGLAMGRRKPNALPRDDRLINTLRQVSVSKRRTPATTSINCLAPFIATLTLCFMLFVELFRILAELVYAIYWNSQVADKGSVPSSGSSNNAERCLHFDENFHRS